MFPFCIFIKHPACHFVNPVSIFPFIVLLVGLVFLFRYLFSRKMVVKRGLSDAGEKLIGDFSDGDSGKVMGKVVFPGKTLTAPLSKRRCVWYHVVVEQMHQSRNSADNWRTIIEEEEQGDVVLFDGTNYAAVDTTDVKSYLDPDVRYTTGTFVDASPALEKFLEQRGWSSTTFLGFNKEMRYREAVLEKDEVFTVAGKGHWVDNEELQLNIPAEKVLVISATHRPVYVSDDADIL